MRIAGWLALSCAAACTAAAADGDYWVLRLSWSPEYCNADLASRQPQCRDEHYLLPVGLVRHTQFEELRRCGKAPELPPEVFNRLFNLTYNENSLRRHWRTYGACTGLEPKEYAIQLDYAASKLTTPESFERLRESRRFELGEFKTALMRANPGLEEDAIALDCSAGWLKEISVCLDDAMHFRACGAGVREHCDEHVRVRPIRPELVEER